MNKLVISVFLLFWPMVDVSTPLVPKTLRDPMMLGASFLDVLSLNLNRKITADLHWRFFFWFLLYCLGGAKQIRFAATHPNVKGPLFRRFSPRNQGTVQKLRCGSPGRSIVTWLLNKLLHGFERFDCLITALSSFPLFFGVDKILYKYNIYT